VWERELVRRALDGLREEMKSSRGFQAFEQHVVFDRPAEEVAGRPADHQALKR